MNEVELLKIIYENLGGLGLGIVGSILFFIKSARARNFALQVLFEKRMEKNDPQGQYSLYIQQLKYWMSQKGSMLIFSDKGRQHIFQDLVHIKLGVLHKHQKTLFENYRKGTINDGTELYDIFLDMFVAIGEDISKEQLAQGIPQIQIEKYQMWQRPSQAFTISQIETVQFSKVYPTVEQKLEAILNVLRQNLSISLVESERTLMSLNGQLTGKKYKGFVCGPVQH